MYLKIHLKQIGERKQRVAPVVFEYPAAPTSVRELLVQTVTLCVRGRSHRKGGFRSGN